ncbi:hypothetical protein [Streptomyces prasinus]
MRAAAAPVRNARSRADARTGEDLAAQVDPEYVPGPATLLL